MIDLIDFGRIGFAINISLRLAFERASPWGEVASQSDDGEGIPLSNVAGFPLSVTLSGDCSPLGEPSLVLLVIHLASLMKTLQFASCFLLPVFYYI